MGSCGTNDTSNCKISEMTTNPLSVYSLTTLLLKSSDQNPAVPVTKSSMTTLMNKNIPSNNDILAIFLIWILLSSHRIFYDDLDEQKYSKQQ
jgi:hypothetical protein